jgi:hypothetical protein
MHATYAEEIGDSKMYKYKILKKGRKWYEAVTADQNEYKAMIEINDFSRSWETGNIVEFVGEFEWKISGRFRKAYIYPNSIEAQNANIIEKWIYEIEKRAPQYFYKKAISELKNYTLTGEQFARIQEAKDSCKMAESQYQIKRYLEFIHQNIKCEGWWYKKGEAVVLENIRILEEFEIDTDIYKARLHELRTYYSQEKDKLQLLAKQDNERYFELKSVSISFGDRYVVGAIYESKDGNLGKAIKTWKYYESDPLSFGFWPGADDACWINCVKCDSKSVSADESLLYRKNQLERAKQEEKEREKMIKLADIKRNVKELFNYVKENGVYPRLEKDQIRDCGSDIFNTFDIYGGGERITLDDESNEIWVISNNGADGDFWGDNNIRTGGAGAIGYKMTIDNKCKEYIEAIKREITIV